MNTSGARGHIIILGGGFAGLTAARTLGRALRRDAQLRNDYDVVLVDRNDTHTYTPGLYEVATALREDAAPITLKRAAAIPIADALAGLPVRFVQDEVVAVDVAARTVRLRDGGMDIHGEYLILAFGAVTNDLGIPGVREYALSLKTFEDALRIRTATDAALKELCEARIVVAGGGATGVELAGELVALAHHIQKTLGLACHPHFTLVEAGPRLLAGSPDHVARIAKRRLETLGVAVRLNCRIEAVKERRAVLRSEHERGNIPFTLFVWSGGIKPSPVLRDAVVSKDERGRCLVDPTLAIAGNNRIFAAGDAACITDTTGRGPIPATAYIAIGQGKIAARNVLAHIAQKPLRRFRPSRKPPMVVPISGKWAIAYVGGFTFSGRPAFLLRLLIDASYFLRVLSPRRALRFFCSSTMVYFRND